MTESAVTEEKQQQNGHHEVHFQDLPPKGELDAIDDDDVFVESFGSSYYPNGGPKMVKQHTIENYGDFIKFGRYTIFFMIMYEFLMLPQMGNMTFMVYGAYSPQVVACGNQSFHGMVQRDVCAQLPEIMEKTGCQPELETQFGSLGYEMGYYCDDAKQVKRAVSIQMIGVFLGAPLFGQASDWWGRRKVILICCIVVGILDVFVSRAPNLVVFTVIYAINMSFIGGMNTVMHVYIIENVPKRHRVWMMMLLSFSPNIIIFAGLAYVAGEWRTLISIAGYLTIPAAILCFFCYESPRWMIEKGKIAEAEHAIRQIEKWNGTLTEERNLILNSLIEKEAEACLQRRRNKKYSFLHLFYTAQMARWTLTLSFGLFCTAIIAFAMVFNMEQFSGSLYLNSAMLGAFRMVLNIALGASDFIFPNMGRKIIHQGSMLYVISVLGVVTFMISTGFGSRMLVTIACLSASGLCSQLFVVNNVISAELFPTPVRNVAASFVSTVARLGGILSPNLFETEKLWIGTPYMIIVVLMSINFLLFQAMIPETKGSPMDDRMPDKTHRLWKRQEKPTHLLERVDTQVAKLADQE